MEKEEATLVWAMRRRQEPTCYMELRPAGEVPDRNMMATDSNCTWSKCLADQNCVFFLSQDRLRPNVVAGRSTSDLRLWLGVQHPLTLRRSMSSDETHGSWSMKPKWSRRAPFKSYSQGLHTPQGLDCLSECKAHRFVLFLATIPCPPAGSDVRSRVQLFADRYRNFVVYFILLVPSDGGNLVGDRIRRSRR